MLRKELRARIDADPFEPFRIKLVNGDVHDVFDPGAVAVQRTTVWISGRDQNWALFPINKIASLESELDDFHGKLHDYESSRT